MGINGVELMRRLIGRAHRRFIDIIITTELLDDAWHGGHRELNDKIQVMRRSWDAPVVARHRAGEVVGNAAAVQPAETIHEKLALVHLERLSSIQRRSNRSTSSSSAFGCWWRMPSRATSHDNSCRSSAMARRCSPVMRR